LVYHLNKMVDITFFLVYLYFISDFLSKISIFQFIIGVVPYSAFFFFKITCFYIQIISYPFKIIKFLMVLIPLIPLVIQSAIIFHIFFDYFWIFYLHLLINSFIFIFSPYYSYVFFVSHNENENNFIHFIKKSSKIILKIIILLSIAYFSNFYLWNEAVVSLVLNDIFCFYGIKKK
jgi:hypothetical protein